MLFMIDEKMQKYLMKIRIWLRDNWPIWVLLLISTVVYHKWLSFDIFWNGDYGFTFFERELDFLRYSAWDSQSGIGSPNLVIWMWFWRIIPGFFALFHWNSNVWDKFLLFWPMIFFIPLFSYLFAKEVLKNNWGAMVAALVFSFNTYYLAINTQGHFSLTLGGAFALLALFFFWRYFDPPSSRERSGLRRDQPELGDRKNLIGAALICLVVGGYDFRVFYILFFIFLAWPLWLFSIKEGWSKKKIFFRQHFSALALFFGLLFFFNLFWLLPTVMTGSLASNEVVSRELVPNNYHLDLRKTLTLFHPFWNGGEPKWFDDQDIPGYFWLIPVMALLGAYWKRKDKKIVFWFLVALMGVFLSKQDALPLKSAYVWLHQNFPGFNAFREASKFYFVIALSYAILIGAFVSHIFKHYARKKTLCYGVLFLTSLVFLWNVKPILTGEMSSMFVPKNIPADELKIHEVISAQTASFRTLWFSEKEIRWADRSNLHPLIDGKNSPWKKLAEEKLFSKEALTESERERLFFAQNFATRLLTQSNIRYVICDEKNLSSLSALLSDPAWKKIELGFSSLSLFENQSVRPRVYLTSELETISRDFSFQIVALSSKNSSRWDFDFKSLVSPSWVIFSEQYHPDWQLVCGDFQWSDLFFKKKRALSQAHRATDAGLNAYFFEPKKMQEICPMRTDGKIALSLFYRPQSYLYLGGIISLATAFISIFILVFWRKKGYIKKVEQKENNAK